MQRNLQASIMMAAVALLLMVGGTAQAVISVDSTDQFNLQGGNGLKAVTGLSFDAAGADKLVVVVSTEHGFNGTGNGNVADIKYNGISLTPAVEQKGASDATAEIWFLDNPGAIGAGTIQISAANPNGGIGAAYAVSGTQLGLSAIGTSTTSSVDITTNFANSLVIAVHDNAGDDLGNGGGNNAGNPTPTANAPLTPVSSGVWGNQWGAHASGYQLVATPSLLTASFTTDAPNNYATVAAAFAPSSAPLPATLTFESTVNVSIDGGDFNISVFPGKAGYEGDNLNPVPTGTFGDGTVLDYRFILSPNESLSSYADGGAGRVKMPTSAAGNISGTGESWSDLWTTSDPGTNFDNPPADFPTNVNTFARSADITGEIDISGLESGTVYFPHGTFINSWDLTLTLTGLGQVPLTASDAQPGNDGDVRNDAFITEFSFTNPGLTYDTITYNYFNSDRDGSRARFMGAILDGTAPAGIPEPATATLALLGLGGLLMRRRRAA